MEIKRDETWMLNVKEREDLIIPDMVKNLIEKYPQLQNAISN